MLAKFWNLCIFTSLNFSQVNIIQPDNKRRHKNAPKGEDDFRLTHHTCMALWSCSRCRKNIQAIRAAGALPILASLLVSGQDDVILPVMGIIQECATEVRKGSASLGWIDGRSVQIQDQFPLKMDTGL